MSDQEWPEFRRWYELTREEQRIYEEEDDKDHDRLYGPLRYHSVTGRAVPW